MPSLSRYLPLVAASALVVQACTPDGLAPALRPAAKSRAEAVAWNPAARPAAAPAPALATQARIAERRAPAFLGRAYLAGPLAGATVTMYDAAGKLVGEPFKTSVHGTFLQDSAGLPDWIELRASGGTLDGKPFVGELRGVVDLMEVEGYHAALGGVSSLEAAYIRLAPGTSRLAAQARSAAFLGLKGGQAPGELELALDGPAFLQAAQADPNGLAGYVDGLAKAMQADPAARRPFAGREHRSNGIGSLTQEIATKLAQGVLAGPTGTDFGRSLAAPKPVAYRLQQNPLTDALRDQQVRALASSVANVSARLDTAMQELNTLSSQIQALQYTTAATPIAGLVASVQSFERNYAIFLAHKANGEDKEAAETYRLFIKPGLDALKPEDLDTFHNALVGPSGMIQAYSKTLVSRSVFYGVNEARQMESWWQHIDGVRTSLLHMIIEKLEADPAGGPSVESLRVSVMAPWVYQHRVPELQSLRGMASNGDRLELAPFGSATDTALNNVPAGYVYQIGKPYVWSASGVIIKFAGEGNWPEAGDVDAQNQSMAIYGRPPYFWRSPTDDEVKSLINWDSGDHNFVANRLSKANFRQFTGMGIIAQLPSAEYVLFRAGTFFDPAEGANAYRAIYFDGGVRTTDQWLYHSGDSTACVNFWVSNWDAVAEPHWY